jgi:hypothetical protein
VWFFVLEKPMLFKAITKIIPQKTQIIKNISRASQPDMGRLARENIMLHD